MDHDADAVRCEGSWLEARGGLRLQLVRAARAGRWWWEESSTPLADMCLSAALGVGGGRSDRRGVQCSVECLCW